jgi:hypothetical protein
MMVYNEKASQSDQTTARVLVKRRKPGKLPHGGEKKLNIIILNIGVASPFQEDNTMDHIKMAPPSSIKFCPVTNRCFMR